MSLSVIIGTVSLVLIVTTGVIFFYRDEQLKRDTQIKMQGLVDQINDSHYYEYKFDKKQDQNVKNIDQNVTQVYDSVVKLQNNVKFIEQNALLKDDTKKQFNTDKSMVGTLQANRTTVANNTGKNNIVIEGGRTLDGNNEGWSAMNFNGYYNNGDKRINADKSRWRLITDQRAGADNMIIDQWNKNNNWHQYLMMADGTVGINDNKLRFSNKWTGFPDNAIDQSEISNDTDMGLMIVGNRLNDKNKPRTVGIWDVLNVNGQTNMNGNAQVNGQLCVGNKCVNQSSFISKADVDTLTNTFNTKIDAVAAKANNSSSGNINGNLRVQGQIDVNGPVNISGKWRLGDTGDDWLRVNGINNGSQNGFYGGVAAGKLWTAQGGLAGSDSRMKNNVIDIEQNDVDKLLQLNSKSYSYKDDKDQRKRFGFIAQDVEKLYPSIVSEGANGMKCLNYDDIIPLTVESIKNINKKIKNFAPNNKKLCIDGVCLTKEDIIKLKNL